MDTENSANISKNRFKKKKRGKKFLSNAKNFGKRGIFGRGTHIEDDQFQYYVNILDAMKNSFEDAEDKVNMANNVFEQTVGQEVHLASNQIVCKVLESLIGHVSDENLERFFDKFGENFRPICSDRFASHVLQKMVEVAFLRAVGKNSLETDNNATDDEPKPKRSKVDTLSAESYNLETEFSEEHRSKCRNFVERTGKFLLNNLEDFVWDSCANHIMRTCILCLAGVHVEKVAFEKGGAEMAKKRKLYTVPEEWTEVMKEFPARLQMWPQFPEFPYSEHSSALIAIILIALKVADKKLIYKVGTKLLTDSFLLPRDKDEDETPEGEQDTKGGEDASAGAEQREELLKLPKVFQCRSSVILLETLMAVASPKLLSKLNSMLFIGRVAVLAKEPLTNIAVQKLIANMQDKEEFESLFGELNDQLEDLLKLGHTGVVSTLSDACLRLGTKQTQLIVSLQAALHVSGKDNAKELFKCLVPLKPLEVVRTEAKSTFVHLHGSIVVQNLLKFNKPIFLVNCILDTPADVLFGIFNTPNGSHIVDAFLQSKYIGEKSREKLIRLLEGFYVDLAVTKFGSRVVENLFQSAQEGQKGRIVKELSEKLNMLNGSPFGKVVNSKLRVQTYALTPAQWKSAINQKTENKAEALFKDIIN